MAHKIAIIDYGMGNLHSVAKAIEACAPANAHVYTTRDPQLVQAATHVVFPGQGAARDCMAAIGAYQLREVIIDAMTTKPFLGICMGLQVLLEHSAENDGTALLGLLPGQVRFFGQPRDIDGRVLKIPHMGWNQVQQVGTHPLWHGIPQHSHFYFVHSYYVDPLDKHLVAGITDYGDSFTSALAKDNLFAVQFHPEKSAANGLRLLTNFCNLGC